MRIKYNDMDSFLVFFENFSKGGLHTTVAELPDSTPYGLWIARGGAFACTFNSAGHYKIALDIIRSHYPEYKGDQPGWFLFTQKYIRVVLQHGAIYWDNPTIMTPSTNQKRMLFFLKDFYKKERIYNDKGQELYE